jgi:hypothetical protein
MADPEVVYIVTAVVVLGLVAWVLVVLLRAPSGTRVPLTSSVRPPAPEVVSPAPREEPHASDRPKLDSHAEIRDEPSAKAARELQAKVAKAKDDAAG